MLEELCGGDLAPAVGAADPARLADAELVDLLRGTARLAAWAEARQLAALAELRQRRRREPPPVGQRREVREVDADTAEEVAVALCVSSHAALGMLTRAGQLRSTLTRTHEALSAGRVDGARARRICEAVARLPTEAARQVEADVLPGAERQTVAGLQRSLTRAVHRADPAGAERRTTLAAEGRGCGVRVLDDGMAMLWLTGRAELVVAAYQRVERLARDLPGTAGRGAVGNPLRASQARSDAALGLLRGDASTPPARDVAVELGVVAPLSTLLGGGEPGELAGYGAVDASTVRELAADASWRRWLCDDRGVVVDIGRHRYRPSAAMVALLRARDGTCRFPGCGRRAQACDLDHTVPFPEGQTEPGNLAALCRRHHRLKQRGRWRPAQQPDGRLTWTAPTGHVHETEPARWVDRAPPAEASPEATTLAPSTGRPQRDGACGDEPAEEGS